MSKKAKPTVSTSEPWRAIQPYLLGDEAKGITGVFPEAQRLYGETGWNPQMQGIADQFLTGLQSRAYDPRMQDAIGANFGAANAGSQLMQGLSPLINQGSQQVINGMFDSNFGPVGMTNQRDVGLQSARNSQGVLNPTGSLQQLLSGQVNNPYLTDQANAMTANLTRNLNENVMPGIRSEALASGQYGGSRQGIAEGLAASRLNQDLAPALTSMFSNANEQAQQRMYGVANALNDQAFQNSTNNANRGMATDQFNANLGLQNNQQLMAKNQANLANRMQGVNVAQQGMGMLGQASGLNTNALQGFNMGNQMQNDNFNQAMGATQMPQQYQWQNYNNYVSPLLQGAGMGGSQSATNYKNMGAGAIGGALSGAGIGGTLAGMSGGAFGGPVGMGIGAGLGLLGGLF